MNIKYCRTQLTLTGNEISGNTYPIKDMIKTQLGGKWDATKKVWVVDLKEVAYWMGKQAIIVTSDQTGENPKAKSTYNGWCNKCHSYCWGDCDANN